MLFHRVSIAAYSVDALMAAPLLPFIQRGAMCEGRQVEVCAKTPNTVDNVNFGVWVSKMWALSIVVPPSLQENTGLLLVATLAPIFQGTCECHWGP